MNMYYFYTVCKLFICTLVLFVSLQTELVYADKTGAKETPLQRLAKKGINLKPLTKDSVEHALANPSMEVKLDTIKVIGQSKDTRFVPQLVTLLQGPSQDETEPARTLSTSIQLAAAGGLCQLSVNDGVPHIIKGMKSPNIITRLGAILESKKCVTSEEIKHGLLTILETETNDSIRLQAALATQKVADTSMLDTLVTLNQKENYRLVRTVNDKTIFLLKRQLGSSSP